MKQSDYFPLGINPTEFFKPVLKTQSLVQQLGLQNSDKIIGFVGTIYSICRIRFL